MKALIVDDDFINRKYLEALLEGMGEISAVDSGIKAIEKIKISLRENELYDVIFLDIMMADLNGIETLQAIRDMEEERGVTPEKKTKIVMITALVDKEHVFTAFSKGCEYYLVKPIQKEKVLELLKEINVL